MMSSNVRAELPLLAGATALVGALTWSSLGPHLAITLVGVVGLMLAGFIWRDRVKTLQIEIEFRRLETISRGADVEAQTARVLEQQRQLTEQNVLLEEKNRELARANQLKGQFLASMSHELRTPLNAIIGFSDLLLEGLHGPLTAPQQDPLHDIRSAGRHLLTLINDILDLSKIEAGRMTVRQDRVGLALCVREALEMVEPLAAKKGVTCSSALDETVRVSGDARRLRQVALNLLANAVKFTPRGGRVEARLSANDGLVSLEVQDTGIGIAKEHHERIFEAFHQVESENPSVEGTGLGLALVSRLLEPMQGTISLTSDIGVGTTFRVELPVLEESAIRVLPVNAAMGASVIVAEDDEATRVLMSRVLASSGFSVRTVPNGQRTVEALAEKLPQVLVLDLMMPELDGYSVIERLLTLPGHEAVQVLVFTGHQPDHRLDRLGSRVKVVLKGSMSTPDLVALVSKMASLPQRRAA